METTNIAESIKAFTTRINSLWAEYQELLKLKTHEEKAAKEAEKVAKKIAAERAAAEFKPHPKAMLG